MKFIFIFLLFFVATTSGLLNSNILFLSGVPSHSHYIFNKALAEALALRGHNVTFVSPDISNKVIQNFHYIHLDQVYGRCFNDSRNSEFMVKSKQSPLRHVLSFHYFTKIMCEGVKFSRGIEIIKKYPKNFKFDLVINDYVCGPCLLGLLPKFKYPPLIGISAFNNPPYNFVGGDKLGLTVKPFYLTNYDAQMSFRERLYNGFINFFESFHRNHFTTPAIYKQMKEIYGPEIPYADELDESTLLLLVNSHPAIDLPESLPQNVIQVGGMQINEPNVVPENLNEFIKSGKKGAVLMALGTNIKSDELGQDAIMNILEAFRRLPDYNFLWKFETHKVFRDMPSNVLVTHYLPQNDILAHPSIKAFITHAGLLSTHEAVWHGVPMVTIPFIADQHRNSFKSVQSGIALKVDVHGFNSEKLRKAIVEVLHNPKYRKNIQQKSKLFRDQPEKPLERAIWWCEYIMRHPKITHLKPVNFSLLFIGSNFWDIKGILIVIFMICFFGFLKFCKIIYDQWKLENTRLDVARKTELAKQNRLNKKKH